MAPRDREERMLMRQRGAGTHKLADVSFGIDITLPEIPPAAPQASPTLRRQSRRTKTPASDPRDKPSDIQPSAAGAATPLAAVKGKRKLQGPVSVRDPSTLYHPPTSTRSTRSSGPPTSEGLPYKGSRGAKSVSAGEDRSSSSPLLRKRPSTSRKKDVLDLTDEEQGEVEAQPKSVKDRVQTIGTASTKAARSRKSEKPRISGAEPSEINSPMARGRRGGLRRPDATGSGATRDEDEQEIEEGPSPRRPSTMKGRLKRSMKSKVVESIVEEPGLEAEVEDSAQETLPKAGRSSREYGRASTSPIVIEDDDYQEEEEEEGEEEEGEEEEEEEEEEEGEAEEEDETEVVLKQSGRRSRATKSIAQLPNRKARKARRRTITAPVPRARQRKNAPQRESDVPARAISKGSGRRTSKHETVPIVVHRLSTRHHGDYGGEDAVFNPIPPHSNRTGVNAVDVLGQICRELITGSVEKLQQGAEQEDDDARLREWNRKRKAVEAFGEELEERLFEMTETLDYNYVLGLRLRKANKEKLRLREKLLQIRRERELMALRMDEVRRKHEDDEKLAENLDSLNTAFHDIEVAVERGRAWQQKNSAQQDGNAVELTGLEARLVSVAADVSSTSDTGSLLGRVKEFNAFLEKAAAVLEGRA